jgi:hypothetical protein
MGIAESRRWFICIEDDEDPFLMFDTKDNVERWYRRVFLRNYRELHPDTVRWLDKVREKQEGGE